MGHNWPNGTSELKGYFRYVCENGLLAKWPGGNWTKGRSEFFFCENSFQSRHWIDHDKPINRK